MKFRTEVAIESPGWQIRPDDRLLFVGSCFAASIGQRFADNQFQAMVNPYGVMYNPVSILHTLQQLYGRSEASDHPFLPDVVFLTLGTNHVYRLKATGEIVDNCEKRPQRLFQEETLSISDCAGALRQCVELLLAVNPRVHIVLTVSPIRYAKYGYHGSQLSKATLLLAADEVVAAFRAHLCYFPAYEILNDELRDYRFYADDMLHPSGQAVEYVWQQLVGHLLSPESHQFLADWRPIRQALSHKPFHPESEEYRQFCRHTDELLVAFRKKYPHAPLARRCGGTEVREYPFSASSGSKNLSERG